MIGALTLTYDYYWSFYEPCEEESALYATRGSSPARAEAHTAEEGSEFTQTHVGLPPQICTLSALLYSSIWEMLACVQQWVPHESLTAAFLTHKKWNIAVGERKKKVLILKNITVNLTARKSFALHS